MIETSKLYKSIDFLNTEIYKTGKQHPLIYIETVSTRDANRIPIKLKGVTKTTQKFKCTQDLQYNLLHNNNKENTLPD
jgi:hypothetical protein